MGILAKLGVAEIVNARGTVTFASGSIMRPEALQAIAEVATSYVLLDELNRKAGAHIAELVGCDDALVTSGAAAGMLLASAASITGCSDERILCLPDTQNWPNTILARRTPRPTFVYQAMRAAGARIVEVGCDASVTLSDFEREICDRTVGIQMYLGRPHQPTIKEVAALARANDLSVIVDAAGELPPRKNLIEPLRDGADAVVFSGGKAIRGPQNTGIILGTSPMIEACRRNASPCKAVGRSLKVSKEDICGCVAAVEAFLLGTDEVDFYRCRTRSERILTVLSEVQGFDIFIGEHDTKSRPDLSRIYILCFNQDCGCTHRLYRALLDGVPPILVGVDDRGVVVDPTCLTNDDEVLVASALRTALRTLHRTDDHP